MKKIIFVCLVFLGAVFFCAGCQSGSAGDGKKEIKKESTELFAMDTIIDLTVYAKEPSEILAEAAKRIQNYEKLFSVNIETSDVAKLNCAGGEPVQVSSETYELIGKGIAVSERTGGLFDLSVYPLVKAWGFTTEEYRIPDQKEREKLLENIDYRRIEMGEDSTVRIPEEMQIDLGGIAKGYVSQKLIELFRQKKAKAAVVSLGGNVQTYGEKPDGTLFTVGITDPKDGTGILGTIEVGEKAVITSGSYQRYFERDGVTYHHIMDKRTGAPADSDLKSVTVISDEGESADSLATALFVMGKEKAVEFDRANEDVQLILIDQQNEVWTSDGIKLARNR
ncbi:MAG: FAD:protein FMN transferase [Roseburia sp.]|nr:FAD:protein FMN transferase [Roseburia sp.]